MVRKALALLVVVAMVGAVMGVVGLVFPHPADAHEHSAARSFGSPEVAAGGDLVVTITVNDFGNAARVVETLPEGFEYKSSSLGDRVRVDPTDMRNYIFAVVEFPAVDTYTFTYTVTAAGEAGTYDFSGTVDTPLADTPDPRTISGDSRVTVTGAPPQPQPPPTPTGVPQPTTAPEPTGPRATRTVTPATVEPGGEVRVTVSVMEYGQVGALVETLPVGFIYVAGSSTDDGVLVENGGRKLTFAFLGDDVTSVGYTARAMSAAAGIHQFSGELIDADRGTHTVGGTTGVTVRAGTTPGGPRADRSFSRMPAGTGDQVTVTVAASNYGPIGVVVETLPQGFAYVAGSSTLPGEIVNGRMLTFTLLEADTTFSYRVTTADTAGEYDFSGDLVDDQSVSRMVGGATRFEVKDPEGTRSFTRTPVQTGDGAIVLRDGDDLIVSIEASYYGRSGSVEETLPAGFTYAGSSLAAGDVSLAGQVVTFTLGPDTADFTYTVAAGDVPGAHTFSGSLVDDAGERYSITGKTEADRAGVTVEEPPTRRRRGGGGGGGGGFAPLPVTATPTPSPTRAPATATPMPTPTQIIVPTVVPATATPAPTLEPTATPTRRPTATPHPTATPRPTPVIPTVAPTATPVPTPTPRPTARPRPTDTPAPTATTMPTEPPPTATTAPTVAPVEPIPPEPTGMPMWLIVVIIVVVVAVVGGAVGFYLWRRR